MISRVGCGIDHSFGRVSSCDPGKKSVVTLSKGMACLFPWNEVQLNVQVVSWWFLIQSKASRPRRTRSNSNLVRLKVYLWVLLREPGSSHNDIVPRQGENGEQLLFTLISDFHRQGNCAHPCLWYHPSISKGHREITIYSPCFRSMLRTNSAEMKSWVDPESRRKTASCPSTFPVNRRSSSKWVERLTLLIS